MARNQRRRKSKPEKNNSRKPIVPAVGKPGHPADSVSNPNEPGNGPLVVVPPANAKAESIPDPRRIHPNYEIHKKLNFAYNLSFPRYVASIFRWIFGALFLLA